jgi:hypothetical protein
VGLDKSDVPVASIGVRDLLRRQAARLDRDWEAIRAQSRTVARRKVRENPGGSAGITDSSVVAWA